MRATQTIGIVVQVSQFAGSRWVRNSSASSGTCFIDWTTGAMCWSRLDETRQHHERQRITA
jgi:hypothetical protein